MSEPKRNKITTAARSVFLRYGYRRTNMNDIAEAAGVSRAALYLAFKNKEDVFVGVFLQWLDETLAEVVRDMTTVATPQEKLELAFEIWAVRPFELVASSPEASDLIECSFEFAQASLRLGYSKFEATIAPVLASVAKGRPGRPQATPKRTAHILASAVRGFKQAATTSGELRQLIKELLRLTLD